MTETKLSWLPSYVQCRMLPQLLLSTRNSQAVDVLRDNPRVKGLVFLEAGADTSVLQFRVEDKYAVGVLNHLQRKGVGVRRV